MTSNNVTEPVEPPETVPSKSVDDRLIDELVGRAQAEGLQLTGEGGLRWTAPAADEATPGVGPRGSARRTASVVISWWPRGGKPRRIRVARLFG